MSYAAQLHFLRYLIEYEDWPAADGKTLVIFAVFWGNAKRYTWFPNAFPYGMYAYSSEGGLHPRRHAGAAQVPGARTRALPILPAHLFGPGLPVRPGELRGASAQGPARADPKISSRGAGPTAWGRPGKRTWPPRSARWPRRSTSCKSTTRRWPSSCFRSAAGRSSCRSTSPSCRQIADLSTDKSVPVIDLTNSLEESDFVFRRQAAPQLRRYAQVPRAAHGDRP